MNRVKRKFTVIRAHSRGLLCLADAPAVAAPKENFRLQFSIDARKWNAANRPHERLVFIMKRVVAFAACTLSLAACSSLPSWMPFDTSKPAPAATTMQFESEPAGAEARTSLGQTCRTPCSLVMTASEFTVTFALPGYQPQTVPVRAVPPAETQSYQEPQGPHLVPNPVFVQLQAMAPPPPVRKKRAPVRKKPKPAARPAPTAMAPAPAPASPWPPPPAPR